MRIVLDPIIADKSAEDALEREIVAWFKEVLFDPILEAIDTEIPDEERENSPDPLGPIFAALRSGVVTYAAGVFSGKFSAAISRSLRAAGAKWDERSRGYRLSEDKLPYALRGAIAESREKIKLAHKALDLRLAQIAENVASSPALGLSIDLLADKMLRDLDKQFRSSIERNTVPAVQSISVPPDFTPDMVEDVKRNLTENLELSVKNFTDAEVLELRKLAEENWYAGGRMDRLREIIQNRFGIASRRATFLARQETGLVASHFARSRAQSIGSTEYVWHSRHDNRVRPEHAARDGRTFRWDDPPFDTDIQEHVNPGEAFQCLPGIARVDLANGIRKAFRRWYAGELTFVVTSSGKTLAATPNHPVLTLDGWKPIGLLQKGDHIVEIPKEALFGFEHDHENGIPVIGEIFASLRESFLCESASGSLGQFHGDGSDGDVDIIDTARNLCFARQPTFSENSSDLQFSNAATLASGQCCSFQHDSAFFGVDGFRSDMRCLGERLPSRGSYPSHSNSVRFGLGTNVDSAFNQQPADNVPSESGAQGNRKLALSANVCFHERSRIGVDLVVGFMGNRNRNAVRSKMVRDATATKADALGDLVKKESFGQKFLRVVQVRREEFFGHVFNLETESNWFCSNGLIISNCRCVARPILNLMASLGKEAA